MASYVHLQGPYGRYLQEQAFTNDITRSVERVGRQLNIQVANAALAQVATLDALRRDNIEIARDQSRAQEGLLLQVEATTQAIERLNATFQWGFSTLIAEVGSLGASVHELVRIAQTPNRTRAYEYYTDSREAFSRQHFREALEGIDKAINGDGQTTAGYRLDWRFYHQKALIHLGGVGRAYTYVELDKARECATHAVELAASAEDMPGASVAALTASWATYCDGRLDAALDWGRKAVDFDPPNDQAHFQTAKVLMAADRPTEGVAFLLDAVKLDKRYILRAAEDGDFERHRQVVSEALSEFRREISEKLKHELRLNLADAAFWSAALDDEKRAEWLAAAEKLFDAANGIPLFDTMQLSEWRSSLASRRTSRGTSWRFHHLGSAVAAVIALPALLQLLLDEVAGSWNVGDVSSHAVVQGLDKLGDLNAHRVLLALAQRAGDGGAVLYSAFAQEACRRLNQPIPTMRGTLREATVDDRFTLQAEFQSASTSHYLSDATQEDLRKALAEWYQPMIPTIDQLIEKAGADAARSIKRHWVRAFFFTAVAVPFTVATLHDASYGHPFAGVLGFVTSAVFWFVAYTGWDAGRNHAYSKAIAERQEREAIGWADIVGHVIYGVSPSANLR